MASKKPAPANNNSPKEAFEYWVIDDSDNIVSRDHATLEDAADDIKDRIDSDDNIEDQDEITNYEVVKVSKETFTITAKVEKTFEVEID